MLKEIIDIQMKAGNTTLCYPLILHEIKEMSIVLFMKTTQCGRDVSLLIVFQPTVLFLKKKLNLIIYARTLSTNTIFLPKQ